MLTNTRSDITRSQIFQTALPKINTTTHIDHFKPHHRLHYKLRDALTGDLMCDLWTLASPGTRQNLVNELEDYLIHVDHLSRAQIATLELADVYDYVRDQQLQMNDMKSCASPFWSAVWGGYSSGMLNAAKGYKAQTSMFGKLFDTP